MICVFKQACPRAHPDDASWHRLGSDGAHASLAWRATIADSIELAVSGHYLDTAVIAAGLRLPGIGRISTDIAGPLPERDGCLPCHRSGEPTSDPPYLKYNTSDVF